MSMLGSSQSIANVGSLARTSLACSRVHPKSRMVSFLPPRGTLFACFGGTAGACFPLKALKCIGISPVMLLLTPPLLYNASHGCRIHCHPCMRPILACPPAGGGEKSVARASRPLWRERPAPAGMKCPFTPGRRGPSTAKTRRNRARAELALSAAKGCSCHSGRDARATSPPVAFWPDAGCNAAQGRT